MALLSTKTLDGTPVKGLAPHSEKKVTLQCDTCGKKTVTTFNNYTAIRKRRKGKTTLCRGCSSRESGLAKKGKPIRKTGPRPQVHADKHHSWKGGRFVASDGYVQVYLGAKHYRKEHFLVMEKHLGRTLRKGEVVHHIDGNKQNSELANLVLLRNEKEHRAAHNSLYNLSCQLIQAGLIFYNRDTNQYMAVDKLRELLGPPAEANQQPS